MDLTLWRDQALVEAWHSVDFQVKIIEECFSFAWQMISHGGQQRKSHKFGKRQSQYKPKKLNGPYLLHEEEEAWAKLHPPKPKHEAKKAEAKEKKEAEEPKKKEKKKAGI